MKTGKLAGAAALCATLVVAVPAQAADCWDGEQAAAARVRDLQSKLMVATMRCHAMGIDISPAYNGFVRANRSRLEAINGTIKARFAGVFGAAAQFHYDKFTTSLANAYGADSTNAEVCGSMTAAAQEAAAIGGDLVRLLDLADRIGVAPDLPGGRCGVTLAAVAVPAVPVVASESAAPAPAAEKPAERPALTLASLGLPTGK